MHISVEILFAVPRLAARRRYPPCLLFTAQPHISTLSEKHTAFQIHTPVGCSSACLTL